MRIIGSAPRRVGLIATTAGLVAGGLLAVPTAQAAPAKSDTTAVTLSSTATTLAAKLGSRTAGSYLDRSTGKMVVTVTDTAAAQTVREAGAVPRMVARSGAVLTQAKATLDRSPAIGGTAWAVDPTTDQVVVTVDSSVTGAKLAKLNSLVASLGDAARLEHAAGVFSTRIAGGDAIYGGQFRCSLGFNVRSGSTNFFLTAGHCGNAASTWYTNSGHTTLIGQTTGSSFPGNDYAIVQYTGSVTASGAVGSQDITSAANAVVGQSVSRRGSTTGVHGGTVQATNATVTYAEGRVTGMIQTNVCAEPGDSGGPLYAGSTALGLTSGGNGNCTSGGTTFFQPVTEPLSVFGVSVF